MTIVPIRRRINRRCVVGIDQSYTGFGVCIYRPDGSYSAVRAAFPADKYGDGVDRLVAIGGWLGRLLGGCDLQIEHICMEGYAPGRKFGREQAGELGATVKLALRTQPGLRSPACYPTVVAPTALKKFVCGQSAAKKSDMKLQVYKRWGAEFRTDDEADAYGLARIAAAIQWQDGVLPGYQQEVLRNLRYHTDGNKDGDAGTGSRESASRAR